VEVGTRGPRPDDRVARVGQALGCERRVHLPPEPFGRERRACPAQGVALDDRLREHRLRATHPRHRRLLYRSKPVDLGVALHRAHLADGRRRGEVVTDAFEPERGVVWEVCRDE